MKGHLKVAWILAQRDLKAKYLRSTTGMFWFFATPVAFFAIYYLVFGAAFKIGWSSGTGPGHFKGGLPFFIGLTVYLYVSDTVQSSLNLFDSKRALVKKMPLPLWAIWLSGQLRVTVKAAIYLLLVIIISMFTGHLTLLGLGLLLPGLLLTLLFCSGLSLFLCSVAPFIGDVREPTQIIMRVLFYVTPVIYPLSALPPDLADLLWLNPITHMIEMVRNPLLTGTLGRWTHVAGFAAVTAAICGLSVLIFARLESTIHDVI